MKLNQIYLGDAYKLIKEIPDKSIDLIVTDPPYENTVRYNNQDFDSKAFYEWVKTRPYQVWFSSYEISDDSFYKEKIFSLQRIMSNAQDKKSYANEYLYSNKKI